MIKNRQDLNEYLKADLQYAYVPKNALHRFVRTLGGNEQCHAYRYVRCLRYYEYYLNTGKKLMAAWYHFRLSRLGLRYNIRINPNCADKGLIIIHLAGWGAVSSIPSTLVNTCVCRLVSLWVLSILPTSVLRLEIM